MRNAERKRKRDRINEIQKKRKRNGGGEIRGERKIKLFKLLYFPISFYSSSTFMFSFPLILLILPSFLSPLISPLRSLFHLFFSLCINYFTFLSFYFSSILFFPLSPSLIHFIYLSFSFFLLKEEKITEKGKGEGTEKERKR